ncbi:IS110 family transposase [uncultured Oscillibacter sp.]|uniref:IS110 family transposase n=1 Tax=uncultured Oscillibacter sp. TaxID=876091 RepID=UPI00272ABC85|nr:IS110 family transposase [uncultured Oscillibacter sp.]
MFIVGIDIAKRSHMVRVIDSEGRTVCKPFSIRNSCSGCNALLERLRKLTTHKSEFLFAMESTAHYWLALYTRLRKEGYQVVVLNPIQTDAMRDMLMEENKTDEIDTLVIAETIRFGRYKPSSVPQEKLLALRELCRNRFYLIDMGSDLKRKITALLDQVFPEFEGQFSSIFGKTALAVLRQYPTPEKLSRAQTGKLTEVLQQASNGRFGEWKATQLRELAKDSFGIPDCEGVYSTLLLLYLDQLQSLQDAATALEKRIAALFSQFDSTLPSITGIGPVLGAVILSEIRDISCFASADKVAAYAGLNPKVKQSGDMKSIAVHMSKRGSPYLRRAIWLASTVAVQFDPMFKAYYEKKAAEGLRHMNIIGHASKKMTAVIFAVMRDNKIYEPVLPVA